MSIEGHSNPRRLPVVAVDGPSGSGKGTVCRRLANRLGWHLLDSGALYRLVALAGQRAGVDPTDVEGHVALARDLPAVFGAATDGGERILLEGVDVTAAVRAEQTGQGASRVAAWPAVRTALMGRQRSFVQPPGLIADGRDMGTVVFVDAPLKIFLTARAEERARRRYNQLKDKDSGVSLAALSREIAERDQRDANRSVAPLRPASDAIVIDSTALSVEAVVEQVVDLGRARALWR
ncbi:MAG: (d)CMP kinase [Steroidobacteraceae bacterium]